MELRDTGANPVYVGSREVIVRTNVFSTFDPVTQFQISVGFETSSGASGGDTGGEIHPRKGVFHLVHVERTIDHGTVETVFMDHDEPGHHRLAIEVVHHGIRWDFGRLTHGSDTAVA